MAARRVERPIPMHARHPSTGASLILQRARSANSLEQDRRKVSFPAVGKDGDERLASKLRQFRQAHGYRRGRTAGYSAKDALFARQSACHFDGLLIGDLLDAIDQA